MGVGVRLPGWMLSDQAGALLELRVSAVEDGVDSGVVQRVFNLGQQRSFVGFSVEQPRALTLQEVSAQDYEWLKARSGQQVVLRETSGAVGEYIVGGLRGVREATDTVADGGTVENTLFYNFDLVLFFTGGAGL